VIGICRRRHNGSSMHRSPRSVGSLEEDRSSSTAHPQFPEQFPEPGLPVVLSSVGVDPLALARSPSCSLVHLTSVVQWNGACGLAEHSSIGLLLALAFRLLPSLQAAPGRPGGAAPT
jgi:hypothetical protein